MKTALILTAVALTASYIIYSTLGIWADLWLGAGVAFLISAYHVYKLWRMYKTTECGALDETAVYAFKLSTNYIGVGALLIIPYAVLWHVHMPSLLVYTVWAYFTSLSYVGTGYIAAGVLLLALSFFSYMMLYGVCNGHED